MHRSDDVPLSVTLGIAYIDDTGRVVIPPDVLHRMGWTEAHQLDLNVDAFGRLTLRAVLQH